MVRTENNCHMLDITCEVSFLRFFMLFCTLSQKVVQTWFVWHENRHTKLFGIYSYVEMVRIENISDMIEITCKVAF